MLKEETDIAKITLWRDLATVDTRPGDYIQVTDVVVNELFFNRRYFSLMMNGHYTKLPFKQYLQVDKIQLDLGS